MMIFAAVAKLNPGFFDPMTSAATGHVMAAVENVVAWLPHPLRTLTRRTANAAGPGSAYAFFQVCCVGGFVVEFVVPLLMYCNAPRMQLVVMSGMHSLFSLTAYDFSAAVGGFMPFFAIGMDPGAASRFVGWATGPYRIVLLAILFLAFLLGDVRGKSPGRNPAPSMALLRRWRLICQVFWFIGCLPMMFHLIQLHFDPDFRFCGTVLLGAGSQARLDSHAQLFADLGSLGGAAVNLACYLGFCLCVHNGIGPYVGIKTSGSISCLYSNLIVEVEATSNHYFAPILRRFGLPMRLVTDTVTVLESSHEGVARQVHCERIAPNFVFAGIIQASEWRRAGKITTPGKFPGVYVHLHYLALSTHRPRCAPSVVCFDALERRLTILCRRSELNCVVTATRPHRGSAIEIPGPKRHSSCRTASLTLNSGIDDMRARRSQKIHDLGVCLCV